MSLEYVQVFFCYQILKTMLSCLEILPQSQKFNKANGTKERTGLNYTENDDKKMQDLYWA